MIENLRALAVFGEVANAGSFIAAAKRLGLSASVVSHHVTALERELNTPLIYRTTRKLSLTDSGAKLAIAAREMREAAEKGFGEIGANKGELTGHLSVTAPAILQYARFLVRLATFKRLHPKVQLSITFTDRQINIVEEGIDLAFRVGQLKDSSLISRKFTGGQLQLCASPSYLERFGPLSVPHDLKKLEMINIYEVANKTRLDHVREKKSVTVQMPSSITVDSGFAARRVAEEGCGVVKLPDFFVRDSLEEGKLVEVLTAWRAPSYGIFATWPPNTGTNHIQTAFMSYVADIVKTDPDADRESN